MKYILLQDNDGRNIPILFPDSLTHVDMKEAVCRSRRLIPGHVDLISAGFVGLKDVTTSGHSESLDITSREADAGYIFGGDAVAYMPEPIVGNLVAHMRKRGAGKPKALVRLLSELGPEPVPSHGGPAFVVHWTLSIEGVVLERESNRRPWIHHPAKREVYTKMEHAPSHMKALFQELSEKFDAPEEV